jgi:hypothetical protein
MSAVYRPIETQLVLVALATTSKKNGIPHSP